MSSTYREQNTSTSFDLPQLALLSQCAVSPLRSGRPPSPQREELCERKSLGLQCAVDPNLDHVNDGDSTCALTHGRGHHESTGGGSAGTEVRVIHSASTDSDYQISVALPYHYDQESDGVWPVIYVLDANLYFGLVVDMVRAMNIRVEDQ